MSNPNQANQVKNKYKQKERKYLEMIHNLK